MTQPAPDAPDAPEAPEPPVRVLVVDQDRRVRNSLEVLISVADGFDCVSCCADATEALAVLDAQPVDALLIDPRLPELEVGLAFLAEVHERWPQLTLVAVSGSDDLAPVSLRDGAIAFVGMSGQPDELLSALTRGVRRAAIV
jgi:DNA-binding NtrC family response regulator